MSDVMVITHGGCSDGFACAWLFNKAFPDAEIVHANHGTEPPDVTGKAVYLTDFSYKRPAMRKILSQARKVVVLDHHASAEKELAGIVDEYVLRPDMIANPPGSELPVIHFDMAKSGARLAWEHLYSNRLFPDEWLATNRSGYSLGVPPWLVEYTEDRDLWRFALPCSREVNASLRSFPMEFAVWDCLLLRQPHHLAIEGEAILRRERQIVDAHVGFAREAEIGGHKVLAVNATVMHSEIAGELAKGKPFGAAYFIRADGRKVWSVRADENGIDVSELARRFGGGGHVKAAGWEE